MQTFLPYASFFETARVLDDKRLGKQIIEARQIGRAITDPDYGWQNHPAVNMWREHLGVLITYAEKLDQEWQRRRGKHHGAFLNMLADHPHDQEDCVPCAQYTFPPWFGDESFHASHRSNLLRKDPDWYRQFGWGEPDDLPYVWPT